MKSSLLFLLSFMTLCSVAQAIGPFDPGPFDIEQPGTPTPPGTPIDTTNHPADGRPQRM